MADCRCIRFVTNQSMQPQQLNTDLILILKFHYCLSAFCVLKSAWHLCSNTYIAVLYKWLFIVRTLKFSIYYCITCTYIHTKGPSASYLALLAISDIPTGSDGTSPSVRIIRTCVYFPESYYDKHTNTTEICPDYYIYPLERSICLMFSIMINIRYVSRCVNTDI